jgi:hypothetical protein
MLLIDTDIAVDLIRNHPPAVAWLASVGNDPFWISGFTAFELFAWCRDSREQQSLRRTLARYRIVWLSPDGCELALQGFQTVHLSHGIGTFDMLIGQTALELGLPLYTFNVKHFGAIAGLTTIQPYAK